MAKKRFLVEVNEVNGEKLNPPYSYIKEIEIDEIRSEDYVAFRLYEEIRDQMSLLDSDEVIVCLLKPMTY